MKLPGSLQFFPDRLLMSVLFKTTDVSITRPPAGNKALSFCHRSIFVKSNLTFDFKKTVKKFNFIILDDYVISNLFATKGSREFYLRNSFNIYETRVWDRRSSKKNEKRFYFRLKLLKLLTRMILLRKMGGRATNLNSWVKRTSLRDKIMHHM